MSVSIEQAVEADLPGILAIYNHVIETSTAVYTERPVSLADRKLWMEERGKRGFPVLVARDGEGVAGFGSFGDFRPYPCYLHTVEHSVHVRADRRGQGLGKALLQGLLEAASVMGKHVMVGAIDADNLASIRMHEKLGFERVAHMPQVGRKFGRWLDLVLMQRLVAPAGSDG